MVSSLTKCLPLSKPNLLIEGFTCFQLILILINIGQQILNNDDYYF